MTDEFPAVVLRREVVHDPLRNEVRTGTWQRLRRGAYLETPAGAAWEQRRERALAHAVAAQRQLGVVTVSHDSAALVHGLQVWQTPDRTSIIQPSRPRSGLPFDIRRRTCSLAEDDVVLIDGLRVTSIERTIVDCAGTLHPRDALVVADSGMRALLVPDRDEPRADLVVRVEELRGSLLARIAAGARGAVRARAVISVASPLAETAPESVVRWVALSNGLPPPELQRRVVTARGTVWTDLAWPSLTDDERWHHVEFDGTVKYTDDPDRRAAALVLLRERQRETAITDTGDTVLRIYSDDLVSETRVLAKLRAGLPRRLFLGCTIVPALRPRVSLR